MANPLKKAVKKGFDFGVYSVLSDKQRQTLSQLLSKKQKRIIQRWMTGKYLYSEKEKLNQLKYHLYSLGFEEKALEELNEFYQENKYDSLQRDIAWAIALWHIKKQTKEGARAALPYIKQAARGETKILKLRRLAIVTAECCDILYNHNTGKALIDQALRMEDHPDLYLAKVNHETEIEDKLQLMNKVMSYYNLKHITFLDLESPTYDELAMKEPLMNQELGPKVSVIVPAYNAGDGLSTAIESLLLQTWGNLEVLVVDDHSTDNTTEIAEDFMKRDSRVKLFQTPTNSGPYVARNIGLKQATGEFVTVNDSDDWSHAQKIEIQVKHLLENQHVIANTSAHARLTEKLTFYRRTTQGKYIFPNMSSIMFRKEPIQRKLGYWDAVRFAADGEFKQRIITVFGRNSYVDLESGPLSFPRQSVASLTGNSSFGYDGYFMGARKFYKEQFTKHHQRTSFLYYPYERVKRQYYIPEPMWVTKEEKPKGMRQFDLVICADFREKETAHAWAIQIRKLKTSHNKIGLVQFNSYDLNKYELPMDDLITHLINEEGIEFLTYGEKVNAEKVIITNATDLLEEQRYIPDITTKHAVIKEQENLPFSEESLKKYVNYDSFTLTDNPLEELDFN